MHVMENRDQRECFGFKTGSLQEWSKKAGLREFPKRPGGHLVDTLSRSEAELDKKKWSWSSGGTQHQIGDKGACTIFGCVRLWMGYLVSACFVF